MTEYFYYQQPDLPVNDHANDKNGSSGLLHCLCTSCVAFSTLAGRPFDNCNEDTITKIHTLCAVSKIL